MAIRSERAIIALAAIAACGLPASAVSSERQEIRTALAWAKPLFAGVCHFAKSAGKKVATRDHAFEISYRDPGQDQDSPDRKLSLYQLACSVKPGNTNFVFVSKSEGGFSLVSFAVPQLDYDYADETFSSLKSSPRLIGYRTTYQLANAVFDAGAQSVSMHMKWNEADEAWSAGTWKLVDGTFVLDRFDVDPTYARHGDAASQPSPAEPNSYQIFPGTEARKNG